MSLQCLKKYGHFQTSRKVLNYVEIRFERMERTIEILASKSVIVGSDPKTDLIKSWKIEIRFERLKRTIEIFLISILSSVFGQCACLLMVSCITQSLLQVMKYQCIMIQ